MTPKSKAGRKLGQSGARVKYNGKRARYGPINGSIEQYKAQWEYLDSLSHTSGAGSEALLQGLKILMEFDEGMGSLSELLSLATETNAMVSQVLGLVRDGVVLNATTGKYDLNEEGHNKLQSLVSKVSE